MIYILLFVIAFRFGHCSNYPFPFKQELGASSDSCSCISLGTASATATCSLPCDVKGNGFTTGVSTQETCVPVTTVVILQAIEKFKYGTSSDLDTYVAA